MLPITQALLLGGMVRAILCLGVVIVCMAVSAVHHSAFGAKVCYECMTCL